MADRFYVNSPLVPGLVTLQGAEAHHMATVCRVRPGDLVCLFNGDGHEYPTRVLAAGKKNVEMEVLGVESPARELSYPVQVAAPLPKGDRGQFLVEKLTELGVASFVPLRTERSVVHPGETKLEKLQRYVIEASKQCGRNVLLRVEAVSDWVAYCQGEALPEVRVVAHPTIEAKGEEKGKGERRKAKEVNVSSLSPFTFPLSPFAIAVGPEGGFTEEEIELARRNGWQVVDLGPRILRVETAALVLAWWASASRSERGK